MVRRCERPIALAVARAEACVCVASAGWSQRVRADPRPVKRERRLACGGRRAAQGGSVAKRRAGALRQGAVLVTVVSARDIAAADPGGTSDPYVTVKLNEHKNKTATKKNSKGSAEWNEKYEWHKARARPHRGRARGARVLPERGASAWRPARRAGGHGRGSEPACGHSPGGPRAQGVDEAPPPPPRCAR